MVKNRLLKPGVIEDLQSGELTMEDIEDKHFVFPEEATASIGRCCRKRAPTMTGYPVVFGKEWCGDHKLDEEKVG